MYVLTYELYDNDNFIEIKFFYIQILRTKRVAK